MWAPLPSNANKTSGTGAPGSHHRHKLLGVIEASFGDFRKFDRLVRNVLEEGRESMRVSSSTLNVPAAPVEVQMA